MSSKKYPQFGNAIQLQEINSNVFEDREASSDEDVQFTKQQYKIVPSNGGQRCFESEVDELPPLSLHVTLSDVLFNGVVCLITVLSLTVDMTLIGYHYNAGDKWASALTTAVVGFGGMALLSQFWGLAYEQLDRIYTRGNFVRVAVNCFPWMATPITCYQTTTSCVLSRSNPMATNKYVKLQELSQAFLRVQGVAQGAPQAVLQLVLLLEDVQQVGGVKAGLLLTSIAASLTVMMVSNLPLKTEEIGAGGVPKPAAYNPLMRLWIGLRMISSFGSRTLSIAVLFSTSRCVASQISTSSSLLLSHIIPLCILLLPRILITLIDYTHTRVLLSRHRSQLAPSRELEAISPFKKSRFSDILVGYLATIFIPFSDPVWVFWYVTLETLGLIAFGVAGEVISEGTCVGLEYGIGILVLFAVTFGVVPCVVPVIRERVKKTRRANGGHV